MHASTCALSCVSQSDANARPVKKLNMTVSADKITADIFLRFDRKPELPDEIALIHHMKDKFGFKWTGYAETGKWQTDQYAVVAFEDKPFRARIKAACSNFSFYKPDGTACDLPTFIEAIKTFDPNDIDDDLSTLGPSSVSPFTPTKPPSSDSPSTSQSHNKRARP